MQGEHLQLIHNKLICGNNQSYSHCLHIFFKPRISFKQKKPFNCYYFSCSLKELLGQQSFPPLAQILSKETQETPRLSPQTFSYLHKVPTTSEISLTVNACCQNRHYNTNTQTL